SGDSSGTRDGDGGGRGPGLNAVRGAALFQAVAEARPIPRRRRAPLRVPREAVFFPPEQCLVNPEFLSRALPRPAIGYRSPWGNRVEDRLHYRRDRFHRAEPGRGADRPELAGHGPAPACFGPALVAAVSGQPCRGGSP